MKRNEFIKLTSIAVALGPLLLSRPRSNHNPAYLTVPGDSLSAFTAVNGQERVHYTYTLTSKDPMTVLETYTNGFVFKQGGHMGRAHYLNNGGWLLEHLT